MRHGQTAQALFQHGSRLARGQRFHIGMNLRHEDVKQRIERRLRPVDRVILPFLEQMQIRMPHQFAEETCLVDGDDQIQRRHDDGELAERAVRAVRAFRPAHPDLVSVAHAVIVNIRRVRVRRPRVHPLGGRVVHKGFAQQAHTVPDAAVQIQLHQAQVVFRRGEHAHAAQTSAVRAAAAHDVLRVNTDQIEQVLRQIIQHAPARQPLDDRGHHRRRVGIIAPERAGFVGNRSGEIPLQPICRIGRFLFLRAVAHHQQIADGQP